MNNIFYEFLEKNKLNGLEDVLEELPIFEETTMKFPGLPKNVPQPSSIDLIGVEFKLNGVMYNFYVSNVGTKTYCFIADAMMNVLGINDQKNILATIITAGIEHTGNTLTKQTSDKIFKEALFKKHALTNPKNGQNAQIDSLDISTNKKIVFTYTSIYFNQLKQQKVKMVDIAKTGTNSTQGDMQSDMQDNMPSGKGSISSKQGEVINKTGENNSAASKTISSRKAAVNAAEKELKMKEFGKNVALSQLKQKEFINKVKEISDSSERLQEVFKHPKFAKLPPILSGVINLIKELKNQNGFKEDFDTELKANKVSFYKDLVKGNRRPKKDEYNRLLSKISTDITFITPLVFKYKLFTSVNEILKAYSRPEEQKQIEWFYENYVNNHFTMKRIFNS